MRLWATARVPAARLNVNPTNDAGGPAPSTQRAGRTVNPYCLVKDRMDLTGARWGLDGAEAILELRAIHSNGDFEEYWRYHLAKNTRSA